VPRVLALVLTAAVVLAALAFPIAGLVASALALVYHATAQPPRARAARVAVRRTDA
jgi:hypothetical protein